MRPLIALLLPWVAFFAIGRPVAGFGCLLLQLTLIGWLPAVLWAMYAFSRHKTDRKLARIMASRRDSQARA